MPHNRVQLNSGSPRATSGVCNRWETHAYILHMICIMIASGLHVSTWRVHQCCTIGKLLLKISLSMAVHPGFTESSIHDFWSLELHIYTPCRPGEATLSTSWKGSPQTSAPETHVDLTVTFFDSVGIIKMPTGL